MEKPKYRVTKEQDVQFGELVIKKIIKTRKPSSKQDIHDEIVLAGLAEVTTRYE